MEFNSVQAAKAVYLRKARKWEMQESSIVNFRKEQYEAFVSIDTVRWFQNLGSKQVLTRSYTSFGLQVVKLVSYSPDGDEKHEYNFRFIK
jgi:hypothetical protein